MAEKKPDRVYVLDDRAVIEALVRGAGMSGALPSDILPQLHRGVLEPVENGVVLKLWLIEPKARPETPESLFQVLGSLLSENEKPPLRVVRAWTTEQFEGVARWAQTEWAHQTPITGIDLPPRLPRPEALGWQVPPSNAEGLRPFEEGPLPPVKASKKRRAAPATDKLAKKGKAAKRGRTEPNLLPGEKVDFKRGRAAQKVRPIVGQAEEVASVSE